MNEPITWASLTPEQRDELVAEKIFGWQPVQCPGNSDDVYCDEYNDYGCAKCGAYAPHGQALVHEIIPPEYSYQNMNAIKLLRQRMAELHPLLNLHLFVYTYNRCYAAFSLEPPVDNDEWSEGNGEHCMEDAICLAALRACGVLIEEKTR